MPSPALSCSPFGHTAGGTPVERWTLCSASGASAEVLTLGGVLHALRVPDGAGRDANVVLDLPTVRDYEERSPYFGALVGRYANRIAHGRFTLDGRTHEVPVNDRGHALHGGPDGFDRRVWRARPADHADGAAALELRLHSPDGDMGFPGAVDVSVTYTLDARSTLSLDYRARTTRATVLNLTQHAYFNLAGAGRGDVLGHTLGVDADSYLPVTAQAIPLGPQAPTADTPFDLRACPTLGAGVAAGHPQVRGVGGFDHCWVLAAPSGAAGSPLRRAARLADPVGGRRMAVWTTEPGLQVYTGNGLDGALRGSGPDAYGRHAGVCLETQHLPDSPNRPDYPSTVLRPGETFRSRTEFRFPRPLPAAD